MKKKILFSIIIGSVIGVLLAYLGATPRVSFLVIAILIGLVVIYIVLYQFYIQLVLCPKIGRLITSLKPSHALKLLNRLLKNKSTKQFETIIKMDKAFALELMGDFDGALSLMKEIEAYMQTKASKPLMHLYYNNMLSYFLDCGERKKAREFYQKEVKILEEATNSKNPVIRRAVESTLCRYNIEFGDAKDSKKRLLVLLPTLDGKLSKLTIEYYISLADLKLENIEEAHARMKKIHAQTKEIFIYDQISNYIK